MSEIDIFRILIGDVLLGTVGYPIALYLMSYLGNRNNKRYNICDPYKLSYVELLIGLFVYYPLYVHLFHFFVIGVS
jgi:hypothetical protein